MTYEYEQIGEFTREYTVLISQASLDERVQELTSEVASSAHLKGFRKGRTPRKVISQRYGTAIESDVLEKIVNENCNTILAEEGLQPGWIGRPYLAAPTDAPYTYKVRVETMPQIEIGDLSELTIKRPNVILNDDDVRKQIESARIRCIDWFELKSDEIQTKVGDRVWLKFLPVSESATEGETDAPDDRNPERIPIILLSPKNEIAESFHSKLVGLRVGDQLEVSIEELSNELGRSEDATPNDSAATVVRIDTGDLPHVSPNLLGRPEFRHLVDLDSDVDIESIHDLMPIARSTMEQNIERTMAQILQNRAMWALAKQHVTSVPREVLRQRFLEGTQIGEQNLETTFMAFRLFDPIVDGEALERKLLMAEPHDHDHDHNHDHDQDDHNQEKDERSETTTESKSASNGDDALIPESLRTFWTGEVNRAIQRVAFTLTQQALIEQRNIEADQEWVASQIQAKAESVNMVDDQSRAQEYLDYVYGEQHYQELVTTNLLEQATKLILDEATIEDEDLEFDSFISQSIGEDAEEALEMFDVAPSLPAPEGFTTGTENSSDNSTEGSLIVAQEDSTEATEIVEDVPSMKRQKTEASKPGIFKKLFRKNG